VPERLMLAVLLGFQLFLDRGQFNCGRANANRFGVQGKLWRQMCDRLSVSAKLRSFNG